MKITIHRKLVEKVRDFQKKADRKTATALVKILKKSSKRNAYFYMLFSRMEKEAKDERFGDFRKSMDEFWAHYGKLYGKTKDEIKGIYEKVLRRKKGDSV